MKYMKSEQEPVDVTKPVLELVRGVDFAFNQNPSERTTSQTEQLRYAAALAAIGRFLTKIDRLMRTDFCPERRARRL